MKIYPPEILRLLEFDGFNAAFEEEMPKHETYYLAYETVEQLFESKFGKRRYADYDSFRAYRSRVLNKVKK